ncbi:hypothetical protein [Pseudokordiimonas caeni]|uniref:hypothetical protein n=1 Tax=Pseudokordiimonas caeni TaxID=2997908 RepID=UPI0028110AE9|nr:hypothetical protein [Pseudokordiimonas caeni]
MKLLSNALLCFLLAACSAASKNEFQSGMNEPTPQAMKYGSRWSLLLTSRDGSLTRSMIVEFSAAPAESCSSGEFRKLKILSEYPARDAVFLGEAAYEVVGAAILIDLSANICDAGYELRGRISETGVEGIHQPVSMFGGDVVGRFYGMPLE